jgi:Ca2+-binding EF-hand superfamily protein
MNEKRKNIVGLAFKKLDKDGSGVVNMKDIVGVYDPS